MNKLREAAQQALEFLYAEFGWNTRARTKFDVLRAALQEPVQGPDINPVDEYRSQAWHDGVIEGHSRGREYWLAQQAQPVQEPDTDCHAQGICQRTGYSVGQRKPLSKEEIAAVTDEHWPDFVAFARAVEAAHGIGGEP